VTLDQRGLEIRRLNGQIGALLPHRGCVRFTRLPRQSARPAHQVCLVDGAGKITGERRFPHGGVGLAELSVWLLATIGAAPAAIAVPRDVLLISETAGLGHVVQLKDESPVPAEL
jgi:hypothetical protein